MLLLCTKPPHLHKNPCGKRPEKVDLLTAVPSANRRFFNSKTGVAAPGCIRAARLDSRTESKRTHRSPLVVLHKSKLLLVICGI